MANGTKDILLAKIRNGATLTRAEQMRLSLFLAVPAILAQLSSVLMQYIDAAMVGRLGASQAASIGLVSTSTWIFGGFCMATSSGFSVQIAQLIGADRFKDARTLLRKALVSVLIFSLSLSCLGLSIAGSLPGWLGGTPEIIDDARRYLTVYLAFLPVLQLSFTAGAMLQASGNMKVPSILNILMCVLDVAFNYLFIYRLGMGVMGAALGTGVAMTIAAVLMLAFLLGKSPELHLRAEGGSWIPDSDCLSKAWGISGAMYLQNIIMRGAYIMSTVIVAPLGTIAIAANSFAITAESFCYMPGYGLEEAATTLVGQSIGARRKGTARGFAFICTGMGAAMMSALAVLMYVFAPQMMQILTTDPEVISLGAKVLRIEAFAETFYAVSIVAYGACVGAGDTLVPSALNFLCMWVIRIGLAVLLTPKFGLTGYWIAMCIDLHIRGILFLWRICGQRWMKKVLV